MEVCGTRIALIPASFRDLGERLRLDCLPLPETAHRGESGKSHGRRDMP